MSEEIFVFGSNLAGRHGAGAALYAHRNLGAEWGVGEGLTGECYALPTKDHMIGCMSLSQITGHVNKFLEFAKANPDLKFRLTAIGCGLAGFTAEQIAPMLCNASLNVRLPPEFRRVLHELPEERFWSMSEFPWYSK